MAFYWKHKYVFTSRTGAGGSFPPILCVYSMSKKKQCCNFSNHPIPSLLQVVPFTLKDLKSVLHTFLLVSVAFNCGAAHAYRHV